jgi:hypothetical protein
MFHKITAYIKYFCGACANWQVCTTAESTANVDTQNIGAELETILERLENTCKV